VAVRRRLRKALPRKPVTSDILKQVAFLRGINLGKRRMKMEALRQHFVDLGLESVETFIASGNVVFQHSGADVAPLEDAIEHHLHDQLGFDVQTFVRSLAELARLSALDATSAAESAGFTPHVIFLRHPPSRAVMASLTKLESNDDRFHAAEREVLWFRRGGLSDSPIKTRDLEKALEWADNSTRNMNTVRRILAKFAD